MPAPATILNGFGFATRAPARGGGPQCRDGRGFLPTNAARQPVPARHPGRTVFCSPLMAPCHAATAFGCGLRPPPCSRSRAPGGAERIARRKYPLKAGSAGMDNYNRVVDVCVVDDRRLREPSAPGVGLPLAALRRLTVQASMCSLDSRLECGLARVADWLRGARLFPDSVAARPEPRGGLP